jgi:hypothetical protein
VLGGGSSSAGNMGVGRSDSQQAEAKTAKNKHAGYLMYRYQRRWPSAYLQVLSKEHWVRGTAGGLLSRPAQLLHRRRSCPRGPAARRRAPRARGAQPRPVLHLRCAGGGGRAPPLTTRAACPPGSPYFLRQPSQLWLSYDRPWGPGDAVTERRSSAGWAQVPG